MTKTTKTTKVTSTESTPAEGQKPQSLAEYIAEHERDDIVLVRVTYPGAEEHVFPGRFSGITVTDGAPSRLYADGTAE